MTGQDVPRRLGGIFDPRHPAVSSLTLAKEVMKGAAGALGVRKYGMHAPNRVLRPTHLRDGQSVIEFLRANPCSRAVDKGETADGLAEVLTPTLLDRLVRRGGTMILYTHLGKVTDAREPLRRATRAALGHLTEAYRSGRVLVTTTRRLVAYVYDRGETTWECRRRDGVLEIDVRTPGDGSGLCFEVADPERARVVVNGTARPESRAAADPDGARYVCLPWSRLEFPRL